LLHNFFSFILSYYATNGGSLERVLVDAIAQRSRIVLCNVHMAASTSKARALAARTEKHRKMHSLVQTWVSLEMRKALDARAKSEGRTLANFVRHELGKIVGIAE
jgi:hypothetical protein